MSVWSAGIEKSDRTGLVIFSKTDKIGSKFKSDEILNLIGKSDRILVYQPVLQINRTGFEVYQQDRFLGL
jgi:hypothetical protein